MAEKYYGWSPYNYCAGDPISFVDLNGEGLIEWLLAYKIAAIGMEYGGKSAKVKTIGFTLQKPITALIVGPYIEGGKNISTISTNFAVNMTKEDHSLSSSRNALRHVIWQALITRNYGVKTAKRIGNVHEEDSSVSGHQEDTIVDQKNNEIGREIGLSLRNKSNLEIVQAILEYYRDYGLWEVTVQNDGIMVIERKKLPEEHYFRAIDEILKLNEYGKEK